MEGCRPNVPFAVHSDSDCADAFRPSLLSMIPRVTDEEIMQAFASTVVSADHCADESAASVSASLRNLNIQNNVLFRMIVHSKQFQERSSGMLNVRIICCFVCVTHFSGATSQTFSSLTSSVQILFFSCSFCLAIWQLTERCLCTFRRQVVCYALLSTIIMSLPLL